MENINNNNTSTMMNNNTITNNNSSFSMTEPSTTKKHQAETSQPGLPLYNSAARNLREYHGVPSMTAESLEKTMALLQLRPARLVAQGLAPRKLLKDETGMPDTTLDSTSSSSSSNSEVEEEEDNENTSEAPDSSNTNSGNELKHGLATEDQKRPIHAALAAAGIKLRPRETRPLLLALGVRPRRLVKLGLVERKTLLSSRRGARGHGIGRVRRGIHHQRAGGEGFGRPQHAPHRHPHPHPRDHGRSPTHRRPGRSSSPIHRSPPGPFHRAGRHGHQHQGHMQPFHDGPPHHHGRPNHAHGPPPGASMRLHHEPAHFHSGESDGEEGAVMHMRGGSPGRCPPHGGGEHGPLRDHGPHRHRGRPHHAHGRRPQGGGRHAHHAHGYHHHQGHYHGEDMHSSGSEEEELAATRWETRHHGDPRRHGGGNRHLGRHDMRRLTSNGEDGVGKRMMMKIPEGPPRRPAGGAGRHHHAGDRHHHHHLPPPPPASPLMQAY